MRGRWVRALPLLVLAAALPACSSAEERLAEHLRRGELYSEKGEWNEARIEFWNALKLEPNLAEAHFKMAEALMQLQQFADARWEYKEAVRLAPDNLEWRRRLAEVYITFGALDDALRETQLVLDRDPDNVDALVLRAVALAQKDEREAALAGIERALEIDPKHERALRLRARALEARGDVAEAEATYERLVKAHPSAANHLRFALFFSSRGEPLKAVARYRIAADAAKSADERTGVRRVLAAFYMSQGDPKMAEQELLEARKEAPGDSVLALTLARFYASQGQPGRAEDMLQARVEQAPDDVEPLLTLADFYRRSGDFEKALEKTERALALDPSSETARLQKAEYLIDRRDDDDAREEGAAIVEKVLRENPNSVAGLLTQAKALLLEGRYEEAAGKVQRVLDEQPSARGHLLLGWAYVGMAQNELARSEFLRAVQLDPDNHTARRELASLYLRTGQLDAAAGEARRALEQQPDDVQTLLVLADVERALGRSKEALEALGRVRFEGASQASDTRENRLVMGRLYRRLGDAERAREHLEVAAARYPADPAILRELVALDVATGAGDAALARLSAAIEAHPSVGAIYSLRGAVYTSIRDEKGALARAREAEQDLRAAIDKDPSGLEAYGLLAMLYRETGQMDRAIRTFEQARDARPDSSGVHLALGTFYEQSGRVAEAMREYEEVVRRDPKQPIAKNNLAWLLAETGSGAPEQLDRALALAQDARELLPENPNVADTLGWIYLKKELPKAAIPLFEEAAARFDAGTAERSVVRYHLALAHARSGETSRAIAEVERALAEAERFPNRAEAEALLAKLRAM
jgi:tetratricopeptide (TPR) repeat protein